MKQGELWKLRAPKAIEVVYVISLRTQAIALTETLALGVGATMLKLYPELKDIISFHGVFFFYSAMGIICALWGVFTIPDNRGKSLVKVEEIYENNDSKNKL